MARPWNYYSAVTECPDCEGTGWVGANRRATVNDPYPEVRCDCGGEPAECPVCGYTHHHQGYDCLACETAASLMDDECKSFDPDHFARALATAIALRIEADRKDAARNVAEAAAHLASLPAERRAALHGEWAA